MRVPASSGVRQARIMGPPPSGGGGGTDGLTQVLASIGGTQTLLFSWDCTAFNVPSYEVKSSVSIDSSQFHSSPSSMKFVNPGPGVQPDQGYQQQDGNAFTVNLSDTIIYRWWMKMNNDVSYSNQNKWKSNRWVGSVDASLLTGYTGDIGVWPGEHNAGFASDQGAGSGGEGPFSINYDFTTANTDNQNWQEYIVGLKVQSTNGTGTADGYMKFWVFDINGVNKAGSGVTVMGQLTGVRWWSTAQTVTDVKGAWYMWNFPQDVGGTVWTDDFKVYRIT